MLPPFDTGPKLSKEQRELLKIFKNILPEHQQTLLKFARFLHASEEGLSAAGHESSSLPEPLSPDSGVASREDESVITAMRRLSKTYFMLEGEDLLNKAASHMSEHVMQGKDKTLVIEDLEALFKAEYQAYVETFGK